jgi:hypothetical protein
MRKVVYRCVTGLYDTLDPMPLVDGWEYIVLTDTPELEVPDGWKKEIIINHSNLEPTRLARRAKILYWQYIGDADIVLWLDGNVVANKSLDSLVSSFLTPGKLLVSKAHDIRTCAYKEALICSNLHKDDPEVILDQISKYRKRGFPENRGLIESWAVLRRDTSVTRNLMMTWWEEVSRHSRRDQISFDYSLWIRGLRDSVDYIKPDLWLEYFYRKDHHS